ncbi:unnamed protein product [Acanthoscelides obtectus]|uniref:FLYWCH-type domain-containing protein n=1 Tax=Acanthoscelides obtectus TaxID=200917 RepID=A0A9P0MJG3_ACAOB|nr:unnamed protein product [Acanthoscelides obtectus]CAK1676577.1 hypothetical protein AOBTE_LOCUS30831 [Acanthoscelides obtectus]
MKKNEQGKTSWICNRYFHPNSREGRCKVKITTSGKVAMVSGTHNHFPVLRARTNMRSQNVRIIYES